MDDPRSIRPGDVFTEHDHRFDDGTVKDSKFLVVVGIRNGNVLYFLTTSQQKFGRTGQVGCQRSARGDSSFMMEPPKQKKGKFKDKTRPGFMAKTWIVLTDLYLPETHILEKKTRNKLFWMFQLSSGEFGNLMACFKGADSYAPIHAEFR